MSTYNRFTAARCGKPLTLRQIVGASPNATDEAVERMAQAELKRWEARERGARQVIAAIRAKLPRRRQPAKHK